METLVAAFAPVAHWTAGRLVEGSIQGAAVIALVWLVCRVTSLPPKLRAMLWWIASAKLVLSFLALPGVPLRLLPAGEAPPPRLSLERLELSSTRQPLDAPPPALLDDHGSGLGEGAPSDVRDSSLTAVSPLDVLTGVWFVVVVLYAAALVASHRRAARLVAAASPIPAEAASEVAALAARLGVRPPRVIASEDATSPQAMGVWDLLIVLPADLADRVTPEEWRMAVCHELMHLRRRDLLWGWIPALAERLFFFHPLAHTASEQYLLAREAACDAAVVHALDVDVHDYGRMLVRLGVARTMPGFAASGASPAASTLQRRLEMLHQTSAAGASRAHWIFVAAAVALVPFRLAAQAPQPGVPPLAPPMVATAQASSAVAERLERQRAQDEQALALEAARQQEASRLAKQRLEGERQRAQDGKALALEAQRVAQETALETDRLKRQLEAERETARAADAALKPADARSLDAAIARLKEAQEVLSQQLTDQHPDMIELQRNLAAMERQLQLQQRSLAPQPNAGREQARPQAQLAPSSGADALEALRLRQKISALEQEVERLKQELDSLKRSRIEGQPRSDAGRARAPSLGTGRFDQRELDRAMNGAARSLPKIVETAMRSEAREAMTLRASLADRYQPPHPDRQSLDLALNEFQQRLALVAASRAGNTASAPDSAREEVQAAIASLRQSLNAIRAHTTSLTDVQRAAQIMNGLREQQRLTDERRRELQALMERVIDLNQQNQAR